MNIIENAIYQFNMQSHKVQNAKELKNIASTILLKLSGSFEILYEKEIEVKSFKPSKGKGAEKYFDEALRLRDEFRAQQLAKQ